MKILLYLFIFLIIITSCYSISFQDNQLFLCQNDPYGNCNVCSPYLDNHVYNYGNIVIHAGYKQITSGTHTSLTKWYYEGNYLPSLGGSTTLPSASFHCWSTGRGITHSFYGSETLQAASSSLGGPIGNWRVELNIYSGSSASGTPVISESRNFQIRNCNNNIQDINEEGIDCGGACGGDCCSNGIKDSNEYGIDCGGSCTGDCCSNGFMDTSLGETGVDCGGQCGLVCPTCDDGIQNQGEVFPDCGGPCPTCTDSIFQRQTVFALLKPTRHPEGANPHLACAEYLNPPTSL